MSEQAEGGTVMAFKASIVTVSKANKACCYMGIDLSL